MVQVCIHIMHKGNKLSQWSGHVHVQLFRHIQLRMISFFQEISDILLVFGTKIVLISFILSSKINIEYLSIYFLF